MGISAVTVLFQPSVQQWQYGCGYNSCHCPVSAVTGDKDSGGMGVCITTVTVLFQPSVGLTTMAVWVLARQQASLSAC